MVIRVTLSSVEPLEEYLSEYGIDLENMFRKLNGNYAV